MDVAVIKLVGEGEGDLELHLLFSQLHVGRHIVAIHVKANSTGTSRGVGVLFFDDGVMIGVYLNRTGAHDVELVVILLGDRTVDVQFLVGVFQRAESGYELDDSILVHPVLHSVVAAHGKLVSDIVAQQHLARHWQMVFGRLRVVVNLDEGVGGIVLCADDVSLLVFLGDETHVALELIGHLAATAVDGDGGIVALASMLGNVVEHGVFTLQCLLVDEEIARGEEHGDGKYL